MNRNIETLAALRVSAELGAIWRMFHMRRRCFYNTKWCFISQSFLMLHDWYTTSDKKKCLSFFIITYMFSLLTYYYIQVQDWFNRRFNCEIMGKLLKN